MARKKTEKTSAVADTHLLDPTNQALVLDLLNQGWVMEQLQRHIPGQAVGSKYEIKNEPFVVFRRSIKNPRLSALQNNSFGKNTPVFPNSTFQGASQSLNNQGVSALNLTGSSSTMGDTHSQVRPQGSNADAVTQNQVLLRWSFLVQGRFQLHILFQILQLSKGCVLIKGGFHRF